MINHAVTGSSTGLLYRTSLENLILETGVGAYVLSLPYPALSPLATNSLIKSSWAFLHQYDIQMTHDIPLEPFRSGETPLMRFLQPKHTHRQAFQTQ